MYKIRMGIPQMQELWESLEKKYKEQTANKNELKLFKLLVSCFSKLSNDPRYPGLCTHDIEALSKRYGQKVWESYLENHKPAAGRIFWVYGPDKNDITIIGIEPHPNDKKDAYQKITLSSKPETQVDVWHPVHGFQESEFLLQGFSGMEEYRGARFRRCLLLVKKGFFRLQSEKS